MVGKHVIERRRNGNYTRYYVEPLKPSEQKLLSILRQKQLRNILLRMVQDEAGVKYQTLLQRLQLPSSTLSFYLNHLVKSNVIIRHHVGREHIYTVANGDAIMKLLITFQSSFIDRLIDNVIATWMELRHSPKESE
jgi:predicted transcriptional regulator